MWKGSLKQNVIKVFHHPRLHVLVSFVCNDNEISQMIFDERDKPEFIAGSLINSHFANTQQNMEVLRKL